MTPAELLSTLAREGVHLALTVAGGIRYRGDCAKVNAYLPTIHEHKPELLRLLAERPATSGEGPAALPAGADPLDTEGPMLPEPWDEIRRWVQRGWRAEFGAPGPDGRQAITWHPPGTWKPEELHQSEPAHHQANPEAETAPTGGHGGGTVCCGDCAHFRPDPIGDGTGIGSCGAGVPARAGWPARYPNAERHCRDFTASTSTSEAAP